MIGIIEKSKLEITKHSENLSNFYEKQTNIIEKTIESLKDDKKATTTLLVDVLEKAMRVMYAKNLQELSQAENEATFKKGELQDLLKQVEELKKEPEKEYKPPKKERVRTKEETTKEGEDYLMS